MSDIVYEKNDFAIPFLRGYRELKIPILDDDGMPVWPQVFGADKISQIRQTVGERYFSAQMMLNFIPINRVRLDPGQIIQYTDDFNQNHARIGENKITGACVYWDPSSGRRGRDGSVCVMLYRDDNARHIFIHDVMYMVAPEDVSEPIGWQCGMVLDFMSRHLMRRIAIETNGIGGALPEIMRNIASQRGVSIVIDKIINSKNKALRICDSIEPFLGAGRMHAHTRVARTPLFSEMIGWTPNGASHDDGIDAVAGAICAVPVPVRIRGSRTQIINANTNFNL